MSQIFQEQAWQFRVHNSRSRFLDKGIAYFEARSTEKASSLGYRLVASKSVKLDRSRNNVWMITGTAILEAPSAANKTLP